MVSYVEVGKVIMRKEKSKTTRAKCQLCGDKITDAYRVSLLTYGNWEKYLHIGCIRRAVDGVD